MPVVHVLLRWFHDAVWAVAGVLRWMSTPFWMRKLPPFCSDWGMMPAPPARIAPAPPPPLDAVHGGLLGVIVATTLPVSAIQPVLPRGVVFPAGVKPSDEYPVSIAFGLQHKVSLQRFPRLPGASYLEFAIGVADLRLEQPMDGFSGPCGILGRLDLNELLPIVLGRVMGLQKVLRLVRTNEDAFGLRSFWARSTVAYGALRKKNQPLSALDVPSLAPIIRTYAQPVVSRSMFGTLAFTAFDWHWDQGFARETSCDLTIDEGLGKGHYAHVQGQPSPGCSGAWQIRVPWTMVPFQQPSRLTAALPKPLMPAQPSVVPPARPRG
jgi:hypothetical protein